MRTLARRAALRTLSQSRSLVDRVGAVEALADDPRTRPADLLPALRHGGYVAVRAAMALHRLTGAPQPEEGPITSRRFWDSFLAPGVQRVLSRVPRKHWGAVVDLILRETVSAETLHEILEILHEQVHVRGRKTPAWYRGLLVQVMARLASNPVIGAKG